MKDITMKIKRYFIAVFLMFGLCSTMQAQIARWLVEPQYDSIEMIDGQLLKVSLNGKCGLLNRNGGMVLPIVYDSIAPFHEERALLFNDNVFWGITDCQGQVIDLVGKDYELLPENNRFYNGMLLVKKYGQYYYLNTNGEVAYGPYAEAYPFFDKSACVKAYVDYVRKPEKVYYDYVNLNGNILTFEKFDKEDITFMSSFHNGAAIIALKKKFYTIKAGSFELEPISVDGSSDKESLVIADKKGIKVIPCDEVYMVKAKNALFVFDAMMCPLYWEPQGKERIDFEYKPAKTREYKSRFSMLTGDNKEGLYFDGVEFLPPQFDKVLHMEDKLAIIKTGGKCGVLTVDEENKFLFKLNNNENIGFNHQFFEAKLTAMMPPYIKCASATVTSHTDGCEIQIESRAENENVERNTLGYDCRLSIPKNLTDTLTVHDYYYSLKYDGFVSVPYKVSISEWYVKYYEVELSNTDFTLKSINDTISVDFDLIKTDVARNDKNNYFKEIEVVASNLENQPVLNRITENHFSFQLSGIDQERVNFSVRITEVGCPTIEYPFEMIFKKPEAKAKNKKTTVTIKPIQNKVEVPENEIILLDD